ncbi:SGNH/GDSL hydrolase family protein [Streptomyces bobili]|uniref:hypothetical protein n=1 Tax=Streptomyces bobili TaxID=67280 RepID=UPI00381C4E38
MYTSLLRKVRAAYPQAWIFALETFRGRFVPQTLAAAKAAVDGGDSQVSFVDTTGRLGSGELTDSVHPNDQGHRVIADRLAPGHRGADRYVREGRGCRSATRRRAPPLPCTGARPRPRRLVDADGTRRRMWRKYVDASGVARCRCSTTLPARTTTWCS